MRIRKALGIIGVLACLALPDIATSQPARPSAAQLFKAEELDQLLAPVALYPDQLLAQVLTASTYPLEVAIAARWVADPKNASLNGEALARALQSQPWDASVKSLVPFRAVVKMMSDRLDWTQKLGDAFLAQQSACLASVQRLRQRAQSAGKLSSTPQQKVTSEGQTIVIQAANPQVVYVPAYNPSVVYGTWPYPSYPPYYYPPPPGYVLATGAAIGFAVGVAVNNNYWGWANPNWNNGTVNINAARYNEINANRTNISGNTWQHNSANRQGVAYRDAATRAQYGQARSGSQARQNYRGFAGQPGAGGSVGAGRTGVMPVSTGTHRPAGAASAQRQASPAFSPGNGPDARAAASRGQFSRGRMNNFAGSRGGGGGGFRGGGFRR